MTEKQALIYYRSDNKNLKKHLKRLAKFKLIVENTIHGQRYGHTDGWEKVQKELDKINDHFDCETFLNDYE
jgi:hypothetical protein